MPQQILRSTSRSISSPIRPTMPSISKRARYSAHLLYPITWVDYRRRTIGGHAAASGGSDFRTHKRKVPKYLLRSYLYMKTHNFVNNHSSGRVTLRYDYLVDNLKDGARFY